MSNLMEAEYSYVERHRDEVEKDLYEKPEIHNEMRHGLQIIVYFIRRSGLVSMALSEGDQTREFQVPNEKVNDAIGHPEYYANDAGLPRQRTKPFEA